MKYYEEIKDPTRVRKGDVVVIPASKAKGLALTPSALSRYGVSCGFTSRSENDSESLTEMFTKPLSEGKAVAFAVSNVRVPYGYAPRNRELCSFFDMDNGDSSSSAPSELRVTRAELAPIPVGAVLNGGPLSSPDDAAAAAVIASPDTTRLVPKAAGRLSRIGAELGMKDLALASSGSRRSADDVAAKIRDVLDFEGRAECSVDSSHCMPRAVIPRDSGSGAESGISVSDIIRGTENALSIIRGYRSGCGNPAIYLGRRDTVTLTADALSLLAGRGAVFLRPTERMRDTMLDRLLQWVSVERRKQSESTSFSVSDVTAAARKALARVRERTASWEARIRKTARSADRNMSGITKETKGII